MQENHIFEFAVIRVVPQVEREEFINVGVVLYCAEQRFLEVLIELNRERLTAFSKAVDWDEVEKHLHAFVKICKGEKGSGPIGKLDIASRFRWLTATRSTVIQTSRVHPGFCSNATETLNCLFDKLVLLPS